MQGQPRSVQATDLAMIIKEGLLLMLTLQAQVAKQVLFINLCSVIGPIVLAPNYFSSIHGVGLELEERATVVTRVDGHTDYLIAYGTFPVPLGRIFQLKVIQKGSIVSVTETLGKASQN